MLRLLVILGAAALFAFPALRERAWSGAQRLLDPAHRWSVQSRLDGIARSLDREAALKRAIPTTGDELATFLRGRFSGEEEALDPWGERFYLVRGPEGQHVASSGPDRVRGTADDLRSAALELRRR